MWWTVPLAWRCPYHLLHQRRQLARWSSRSRPTCCPLPPLWLPDPCRSWWETRSCHVGLNQSTTKVNTILHNCFFINNRLKHTNTHLCLDCTKLSILTQDGGYIIWLSGIQVQSLWCCISQMDIISKIWISLNFIKFGLFIY